MKDPKVYIKNILFNDGTSIELDKSDIVVFTGANNSGKSQVLRDIDTLIREPSASTIVIDKLEPEYSGDISFLKDKLVSSGSHYYLNEIYLYGESDLYRRWQHKELGDLANYFVSYLSTQNRLLAANPSKSFKSTTESPKTSLQKLYKDSDKEEILCEMFRQAFGTDLIINRTGGDEIPIHIGEKPTLNEGEDRVSNNYMEQLDKLPQVQTQGDGMRSFTGILLETFTSTHSITLIDEPEAFLHPSQAQLLGKMLVDTSSEAKQVFISTHSEDFINGLLSSNNEHIKVIRINRCKNINYMKVLENNEIKSIWNDPILRYSKILSGLFHTQVVLCESDTDCRFYQAVLGSLLQSGTTYPDILFTHCGGKQRIKTVVKALRALNVPIAVISDIDILNDKKVFQETLESAGIEWEQVKLQWKKIDEFVQSKRPQLDTTDVKRRINEIFDDFSDAHLTKEIRERLSKIIKQSSAWSTIKETGKSFFTGEAYKSFAEISELCKSAGIFIVPVGELECFDKRVSSHGVKWVNEVLENENFNVDEELQPARDFIKEVVGY